MLSEAKIFWWLEMRKDIEQKVKDCTACLATGKNLKYPVLKNQYGKLGKLSEPGQELQIDFTGKLHYKNLNGDPINMVNGEPVYVGRVADGEIINHMVMARTKTEERQLASDSNSPNKGNPVRYPFNFVEKRHNRNSLEGRLQLKIQTALSGT